jgi:hypothetical protein
VTDDEVIAVATAEGFELRQVLCAGVEAWSFRRPDDDRRPAFLERRQAVSHMADWLGRGRIFE